MTRDERETDNFPPGYGPRVRFGDQGAIDFLSVLGQNDDSHGPISMGEHLCTPGFPDSSNGRTADWVKLAVGHMCRGS